MKTTEFDAKLYDLQHWAWWAAYSYMSQASGNHVAAPTVSSSMQVLQQLRDMEEGNELRVTITEWQ